MALLSSPRIDFRLDLALGCGMRCILCLCLMTLTACANFAQVDAAASQNIGPRPALLTQGQLASLIAQNVTEKNDLPTDDLQARAVALRSR